MTLNYLEDMRNRGDDDAASLIDNDMPIKSVLAYLTDMVSRGDDEAKQNLSLYI